MNRGFAKKNSPGVAYSSQNFWYTVIISYKYLSDLEINIRVKLFTIVERLKLMPQISISLVARTQQDFSVLVTERMIGLEQNRERLVDQKH